MLRGLSYGRPEPGTRCPECLEEVDQIMLTTSAACPEWNGTALIATVTTAITLQPCGHDGEALIGRTDP